MSSTVDRLKDLTRPTGEEELLDVVYPRPRLSLSLRQAAIAAAVVVVLVGGWVLFHALREPEPVSAIDLPAIGPSASTSSADTELVVSVVGEVTQPGLMTLPPGARIDDALLAAAHEDYAWLRRELVDLHYLSRADGVYRRVEVAPERSAAQRQEVPVSEKHRLGWA